MRTRRKAGLALRLSAVEVRRLCGRDVLELIVMEPMTASGQQTSSVAVDHLRVIAYPHHPLTEARQRPDAHCSRRATLRLYGTAHRR